MWDDLCLIFLWNDAANTIFISLNIYVETLDWQHNQGVYVLRSHLQLPCSRRSSYNLAALRKDLYQKRLKTPELPNGEPVTCYEGQVFDAWDDSSIFAIDESLKKRNVENNVEDNDEERL